MTGDSTDHVPLALPESRKGFQEVLDDTLQRLQSEYASGRLAANDFENRLAALQRCSDLSQLQLAIAEFSSAPAPAFLASVATPSHPERIATASGALGRIEIAKRQELRVAFARKEATGSWLVTNFAALATVFSSTTLDFREVNLSPGTTHLDIDAWFSKITIIVSPSLPVELECHRFVAPVSYKGEPGGGLTGPARRLLISGKLRLSRLQLVRERSLS